MQFVGRDFLKMKAPPGYKAGVGRGAVGLNAESAGTFLQKTGKPTKAKDSNRFADAEDEEARQVFDAIEARRKPKRPKREPPIPAAPNSQAKPTDLAQVSIDEWAQLPDVSDSTRWNKRLRETEQQTRRFYTKASIEKPVANELSEIQRPLLERMVREQPRNEEGYLQLAKLEEMGMHMKRARKLVEQGTARIPHSERLWLASIDLHTGADARQIASQACQALPHNHKLWLKAVDVEPTQAAKQQIVQEALLACPQNEQLWLLAAELDPEHGLQILETAREFVDTPAIWLASARVGNRSEILETARARFPQSQSIWQESVLADESLAEPACKAVVDRPSWLEFIQTIDRDSLVVKLAKHLKITLDEVQKLPAQIQSLVYSTMEPSEALYKQWSDSDPQALAKAVQTFPENDELWLAYFNRADHDWQKFIAIAERASTNLRLTIGQKLVEMHQYERAVEWLHPANSLTIYELYFKALSHTGKDTTAALESGLKQWPQSADLVLAKTKTLTDPEHRRQILNDALRTSANPERIWTAIIDNEPATARKRALLVKAVAQHPQHGPLWLRRVQLERLDGKVTTHILAEAHRQCPDYAPLWLEDLLATPPESRKRRLGEAMRQAPSNQLLVYGAQLFAAQNNMETARQWLAKARLGTTSDETEVFRTNPFTSM